MLKVFFLSGYFLASHTVISRGLVLLPPLRGGSNKSLLKTTAWEASNFYLSVVHRKYLRKKITYNIICLSSLRTASLDFSREIEDEL